MSFFSQLRSIAQESYNKRNELSMLVTALVISGLAGFVIHYRMFGYYENAKIGFFILVCCAMWMGLFDSILCICDKRDVLERDKFSGLNPLAYMLATILFQAIHALLQAAVMCAVTGLLVEWPGDTVALVGTVPFEYFTTVFLVTFAAQMLGLAVSALMRTSEKALTFAPFLLIYELIMSETLFGLPSFLEPLRDTTIVRWGLNSLGTVFSIDKLAWKAEDKIQEIMGSLAQQVGDWVSSLGLGLDPAPLKAVVMGYTIDPSIMGIDHNLAEYVATPENLQSMWMALIVLALVGAGVAILGFMRRIDMR